MTVLMKRSFDKEMYDFQLSVVNKNVTATCDLMIIYITYTLIKYFHVFYLCI